TYGKVTELLFAATPLDQCNGGGMVHTEFAFQTGLRFRFSSQLQHQRMNVERDLLDGRSLYALVAQLDAGIDHWMNHNSTGKGFVGVGENLISLAESVSELRRIVACAQHVEPASLCFQGMGRTGVALCCEQRGGCAILCGA